MKPICTKCQRFYRCKKTGTYFIESMPRGNHAAPGTAAPEQWTPYKLWSGDLFECEGCGSTVIVGVAREPIAEHYESNFADIVQRFNPQIVVNDC